MDVLTYTQIAANLATVVGVALGGPTLLLAVLTYLDGRDSPTGKKNGGRISSIIKGFSKKSGNGYPSGSLKKITSSVSTEAIDEAVVRAHEMVNIAIARALSKNPAISW